MIIDFVSASINPPPAASLDELVVDVTPNTQRTNQIADDEELARRLQVSSSNTF